MPTLTDNAIDHRQTPLRASDSGRTLWAITIALLVFGYVVLDGLSGDWDTPAVEVHDEGRTPIEPRQPEAIPHPLRPVGPSPFGLPDGVAPLESLPGAWAAGDNVVPLIGVAPDSGGVSPSAFNDDWTDVDGLRLGERDDDRRRY